MKRIRRNAKRLLLAMAVGLAIFLCGCTSEGVSAALPAPAQTGQVASTVSFSAVDLYGTPVDHSFFEKASFTLVDVWATDCGPCLRNLETVGGMPASIHNLQVLGIVVNDEALVEPAIAAEAMANANADFSTLLLSDDLREGLLKGLTSVPAHYLMNHKGELVTGPLIGAKTAEELTAWLSPFINE